MILEERGGDGRIREEKWISRPETGERRTKRT